MLQTIEEYAALAQEVNGRLDAEEIRHLCRTDLYFLLRYIIGRKDLEHPWLLDRCRDVQENPNGHLDLWSREHYKSTVITFGKTIQDILASHGEDPLPEWRGKELTVGIFSHTRPIAKKFLRQIKIELEGNDRLQQLFPDVLYDNPKRDAPRWSEDAGLVVRRRYNPKESTVEAWGLIDGQPTATHFLLRVYDDVVTAASVTSPDMIEKTTVAWEQSLNLGMHDGGIERYIGTRWHANDTYREIIAREAGIPRLHPATDNGEFDGEPVLWDKAFFQKRVREMGPYTASCQLLVNPLADKQRTLDKEWLRYYPLAEFSATGMTKYLLCDPANEKKKKSDYTAMAVIGLGEDHNYYLLDAIYDRLNLYERADALFYLHRRWKPLKVGYEAYGMQADIQHIEYIQQVKNYRFRIAALKGSLSKADRIERLIPILANGRFYLPETLYKTNYEGVVIDIVKEFVEKEYLCWPVPVHDDMLDAISRIEDEDLKVEWPSLASEREKESRYEIKRYNRERRGGWMSM